MTNHSHRSLSQFSPDENGKEKDLNDPKVREELKQYLLKYMRVVPGTMEMKFVNKQNEEIHLGNDTWRTAGDLSKVAGNLGQDMQECLGKKG